MRTKLLSSALLLLTVFTSPALAQQESAAALPAAGKEVSYRDGETELKGYWVTAQCDAAPDSIPLVLIVHQWKGLGEYEKQRAEQLASHCYNTFAIDMYGAGIRPQSREEAAAESAKYKNDPALATRRLNAALTYARNQAGDPAKTAIMGYCFGGSMALQLARSGANIDAAVSFHGGLATSAPAKAGAIKAALQVHHGAADPHVPPEQVEAFMAEMNEADANWHLVHYADAVHSFTEKAAGDDPSDGSAYNETADKLSWSYTLAFLSDTFASE